MKHLDEIINQAEQKSENNDWYEFNLIINEELTKFFCFDFINFKTCVIEVSSIIHSVRRHGNTEKEIINKQIAINFDDINLIPDIVNYFDSIKLGGISEQTKLQTIKFMKKINDIYYFCICEIRTGRKKLGFKTLYKKPG